MLIRQAAFGGDPAAMLKGGLHCHTTRSDGNTDPADTIRQHAENGYDFLALTDHRKYNFVNYAPETGLLVMPGAEFDGGIRTDAGMCFHTVSVGPEEAKNGFHQDEGIPSMPVDNQTQFQPMIDEILRRNNLSIYCHPQWSCTPARSFENLRGCFAMEIWNSGCALLDELDTDNGFIWDELLVRGNRLFAVAVDDGHKAFQHCQGWVRVRAEKNLDSILSALKNGAFYASCGPEIYDFHIEDGVARLSCSPCEYIHFQCGMRPSPLLKNESGEIAFAETRVPPVAAYMRATVMDKKGRKAWTNPIFLND